MLVDEVEGSLLFRGKEQAEDLSEVAKGVGLRFLCGLLFLLASGLFEAIVELAILFGVAFYRSNSR